MNADLTHSTRRQHAATANSARHLAKVIVGSVAVFTVWLLGWLDQLPILKQLGDHALSSSVIQAQRSPALMLMQAGTAILAILTGIFIAAGEPTRKREGRTLFLLGYVVLTAVMARQANFPAFLPGYYELVVSWIAITAVVVALFVREWTGRPPLLIWTWRRWTIALTGVAALAFLPGAFGAASPVSTAIYALLIAPPLTVSLWWILTFAFRRNLRTVFEALILLSLWSWIATLSALLIIGTIQYGVDGLDTFFADGARAQAFTPRSIAEQWTLIGSLPALVFASAMLIGASLIRAIETNARAEALIAEQRRDLEASRAALEAETHRRIFLEERGRLMRDIHDGIGGQLLTMLLLLRAGQSEPQSIERQVEDCLTDLRLIVDSLDGFDGDLEEAMLSLRARLLEQVRAAGLKLNWVDNGVDLSTWAFAARETLSICRFIQEAVTNAVRHSGGAEITVAIAQSGDDGTLSISIEDDGHGLPEGGAAQAGRGLGNLQTRAKALGGQCSIQNRRVASGLSVVLALTNPSASSASP